MDGSDPEFETFLRRVTEALTRGDDPDALAELDELLLDANEDRIYSAMLIHEARSDITRVLACLDRLEALADTATKRGWLREHRASVEAAQRGSEPGSPIMLAPTNTGIDALLEPIIHCRLRQEGGGAV